MSTKTKLIITLVGIVVCIVAFMLYPKEFLFAAGGLLLVFVFAAGLRNKRRSSRRYNYEDDEGWETPGRDIHVYHHEVRRGRRIPCPECGGTGSVERSLMPIQRGAPGIPTTKRCPLCRGKRWVLE